MEIIIGFGIIVAFLALGEVASILIGGFIPGSVIGMMLLFVALVCKVVKADKISKVAHFLTGNMTIFFIPGITGIIEQWGLIKLNWLGWMSVIVLSTVLVMATTGHTMQSLDRLTQRKGGEK